jgi:hypothetical protein
VVDDMRTSDHIPGATGPKMWPARGSPDLCPGCARRRRNWLGSPRSASFASERTPGWPGTIALAALARRVNSLLMVTSGATRSTRALNGFRFLGAAYSHRLGRTVVAAGRPGRSIAGCSPQRVHSGILRSGSEPKGRRLLSRLPVVPRLECADSASGSRAMRCLRSRRGRKRQHLRHTREFARSAIRPHCAGAKAPAAEQRSCLRRTRYRRIGIWEPIRLRQPQSVASVRPLRSGLRGSRFSSASSSRRRAG